MTLFKSVSLGRLRLKNRVVMTAMSTRLAAPRGDVTDDLIDYYARRAAGGAGLITIEEASIHPQLPHVPKALGVYSDDFIPGLRRLTGRIHESGSKACLQIGLYFRDQVSGFPRYAVSLDSPEYGPDCLELDHEDIGFLVSLFARAAERVVKAGFDAVEVHACHGCIVSEFLSPVWNRRRDEYGGTPGRFRFALDILAAVRERIGSEFPVIFRISGSEFVEGGFTPEDAMALSQALEAGGVTAVSISGGLGHVNHIAIPPSDVPRGILLPLAERIKGGVGVPVICGNSLTPETAELAVAQGRTDLVGLGRPLIADPDWPCKVEEGRAGEVRPCIRCNQGCFGGLRDPGMAGVTCLYNPEAGRERSRWITPAETKRRVVVVGGGPAGCEAARVAGLRGHDVVLLERSDRLGGQFRLAAVPPKKEDFTALSDFYTAELKRLGVDVRLNTEASPGIVDALEPDVRVLALGSIPIVPNIPGADLPHVVTSHQVLGGQAEIQAGPVVVIGGGATGLETADYLSEQGLPATVVEMLESPGRDIQPGIGVREALLARLAEKGVAIRTRTRAMAIEPEAVVFSGRPLRGGGDLERIPAKWVVLGLGTRASDEAGWPDEAGKAAWLRIGDCRCTGNALQAVHAAFDLIMRI